MGPPLTSLTPPRLDPDGYAASHLGKADASFKSPTRYLWKKRGQRGMKRTTATPSHAYSRRTVGTVRLSRRQLESDVGEQKGGEVIGENIRPEAFRRDSQMLTQRKPSGEAVHLLFHARWSEMQLCNGCYTRKGFSLNWSAPSVRGTLRTAAMATMYLLWQRRRRKERGERKKRDK